MEEGFRLNVSPALGEHMSYDKLAGPTPRVLILHSAYWVDGACLRAGKAMGWDVESVPVALEGVLSREAIAKLISTLMEMRPDFVVTINLSGMDVDGVFARFFADLGVPYVTWFVDDPRTILMGRDVYASDHALAVTWEEAYTNYLQDTGFPVVATLPLAVDTTLFNAEPRDSWDSPPTFVGNSMIEFAEREWVWFEGHPALGEAVRHALDEGRVTREAFGQGLPSLLGKEMHQTLNAEQRRHAELAFFVEGTRRLRHALAEALVPEGMALRGDDAWQRSFPDAGGGVHYMNELPAFYGQCEVNLNTTSVQMATTVNQRVFDCPAAGGFLITDAQPTLEDLFDVETEVVAYSSLDECKDLLRFYREKPAARNEVTQRARKRILGEHTYAHRLQHIAALVKEHWGA